MTLRSALDVIFREIDPIAGLAVLDIGCGAGGLQAQIEAAGARWRGLDPAATHKPAIDIAPAEAMPYGDDSFDAAICVNALHHVPVPSMAKALAEAARVLRPKGRLVVIEPKAEGPLSRVIAVVDDETDIRAAAQAAMDRTTALRQISAYGYERVERFAGYDAFCASLIAVAPARAALIAARQDDLRSTFETIAGRDGDRRALSQPMSVRVFQAP